ncbi:MAG: receptor with intracellular metal dependent phosphohydrolase [Cyanobacteria bacterium RYN_339]|nr:receptor with intracellular metal dependent phosphohydrolase [Cyanobacteria bacterium RYN_339]
MTEKILEAAHRFVPPGVQSIAVQPFTHQLINVVATAGIVLYVLLMAQPGIIDGLGHGHWLPFAGLLMIIGTLTAIVVGYLRQFEPATVASIRHLYLIGLVVASTFVIALCLGKMALGPYFSPLVACGMLLAVFVNTRVGLIVTSLAGLLLAVFPNHDPIVVLESLLGAAIAIHAVSRVQQRFDLARAGIFAALVSGWCVVALSCYMGLPWGAWYMNAGAALVSGVCSAILVVGVLPYLEDMFGITTTFKLLELANPSQPLLRELQLKAPGTYHHSILVGNLAEAAAESIGADALLVRVGSYYHDVGKTKRPYFFIENQLGMANQHDRISPRLSALVITAHVKEGLEMAREHKLPAILQEFIATHHGTSLVSYFYHQAVQAEGQRQVQEEHFRYPGPRPRTRETGIVMLADGVEAACRSLKTPTPEQIEQMVRKIVDKRLADGELSEAPLTLKEIEKVSAAFIRILTGLFHHRIEYPDQVFRELRGGAMEADRGKKVGRAP